MVCKYCLTISTTPVVELRSQAFLLLPASPHPVLLVVGSAIPSLGLVAGGSAKAIDHGENDPAVVPDAMRVSQCPVEIGMGGEVHQIKGIPEI